MSHILCAQSHLVYVFFCPYGERSADMLDLRQKKYERLMLSGWKLNMRAILPHWYVV